jgi:hypothetical protein
VNPILRDLQRQLSIPSVVVVIGLLVLAAAGIVHSADGAVGGESNLAITMTYSGEYEFAVFASDNAGAPVAGVHVAISLSAANDSSAPPIGAGTGVTSTAGLATVDIEIARGNYSFYVLSSLGGGDAGPLRAPTPGRTVAVFGVFSVAERGELGLTPWILVAFPGPGGTVAPGLSVAYNVTESSGGGDHTVTGDLGPLTTPAELLRFSLPAAVVPGAPIGVYVQNGTGIVLAKTSFGPGVMNALPGQDGPAAAPVLLWVEEMAVLIMMGAAVIGYVSYGRDRISGAIEPVLALPMSRLRVPAMRFVNASISLAIGVSVSEVALAVGVEHSLGVALPTLLLGAIWVGAMAEGLTILALVFLFSHLSRSHASVLAGSLALAVVFSLLWAVLTILVARFLAIPALVSGRASWQGSVGLLSPAAAALNPVGWALRAAAPNGSTILVIAPDPALASASLILWLAIPLIGTYVLVRGWE